jgi:hypothetical protein
MLIEAPLPKIGYLFATLPEFMSIAATEPS